MLLSLEKRFLFVHVPKTGGTSIAQALSPWVVHPPRTPVNKLLSQFRIQRDPSKVLLRTHGSLAYAYSQLNPEFADSLFKFAFVRNPWDRLVSEYSFILARPSHRRHSKVKALPNFLAYLHYARQRPDSSCQARMLASRPGSPDIDLVGRFENLSADFEAICARIGIDAPLPHLNKTKHHNYREFYDRESQSFVSEAWADEIQKFGYEF